MLTEFETARREAHSALPEPPARAPRPQKLDAFRGKVAELLERYPSITAQRVLEELRAAGFDGGYTAVKAYVRAARPRQSPTPSLPTPVYAPGEMAESDWSPYTIDFTCGRREIIQVFSYVLVYSRRKSFSVFARCDGHALMDGHLAAFERFGGAAHACKYDGQKTVVLGWEGRQPLYNPQFLAFATHYGFRPEACRPFHPNDKPAVERGFWDFERSFLNGRSFRDADDLRAQLARWQQTVSDARTHRKARRPVLEMFAEEQPALVPLPTHPYDTARVVYRVCSIDGFVAFDGNRYAVPYDHVTDILPVRVTSRELFVYAADLRCVARHELAPRGAARDVGDHPPWRRTASDRDQLRDAFALMGHEAEVFFAGLRVANARLCGHHARQILLLRERYTTSDLLSALGHAHSFGAFDHHAVARILAARSAPRTLAEYVAEDAARRLEKRLGDCDTRPRDLDEYDRLPLASPPTHSSPQPKTPCPSDTTLPIPIRPPTGSHEPSDSSD
jgi:transposase